MKSINLFVGALLITVNAVAADALTERLQRGLFEEEANRNLEAAIKEYQAVVTQSDEQRKVTATALFRLGECYRKLGKTNEAAAFYQRITRDFSEQEQLAKFANDFLRPAPTSAAIAGNQSELVRELQRRAALLRVESVTALMEYDRLTTLSSEQIARTGAATNNAALVPLELQLNVVEQKLAMLKGQFGDQHPEVVTTMTLQKTIRQQRDEVLKGIVAAARERADSLAAQLKVMNTELKKAEAQSATPSSAETASTTTLTQAEAEELARVKTLARNSPDLLNAPARGLTELQKAAQAGHYSVAEFILSQGVRPNDDGVAPGNSPLVEAAQRGHLRIVQLLLDQGATKDDTSRALIHACRSGFKSVAEILIARGANVNPPTSMGLSPLYYATVGNQISLVELLLARGARPNVLANGSISYMLPNHNSSTAAAGTTPLHEAASRGFLPLAEMLLKVGADARATNYYAMTPLHFAANAGHSNLCALLLDLGADANASDVYGMTPFTHAVGQKHTELVKWFLQRGANPNQTIRGIAYPNALGLALYINSPEVLSALLAAKPQLEFKISDNLTALQSMVRNNHDALAILLLEAGANPNGAYDDDGYMPLHLATNRRTNLVAALLQHGANPNVVTRKGETPLSMALSRLKQPRPQGPAAPGVPGQPPPASFVYGDGPGSKDDGASAYEEIARLLREHGADEFLQRRGFISAVRGLEQRVNIFSKGTNDVNRYTLMEFLAAVYEIGGPDFPFPDLTQLTIRRLDGKTEKTLLVNAAKMLAVTNDCSGDLPLEWGDNVEIPMADHPVSDRWQRLSGTENWTLWHCMARRVELAAGGTNASIALLLPMNDVRLPGFDPKSRSPFFRLSKAVLRDSRFRNLLRSSSDLARVTVTRTDPQTKETKKMTFDLNVVALPDMSYSGTPPPIPWAHDLWLRDGDVIEVPEKP